MNGTWAVSQDGVETLYPEKEWSLRVDDHCVDLVNRNGSVRTIWWPELDRISYCPYGYGKR